MLSVLSLRQSSNSFGNLPRNTIIFNNTDLGRNHFGRPELKITKAFAFRLKGIMYMPMPKFCIQSTF